MSEDWKCPHGILSDQSCEPCGRIGVLEGMPAQNPSGNSGENSGRGGLANLKPWVKGQSGNPDGRPKRKWLTELHDELLEEKLSDPTFREQYKEAQWAKLLKGNVVAAMTLDRVWERTEGKLPTNVAVTGELNLTLSDRMTRAEERLKNGE